MHSLLIVASVVLVTPVGVPGRVTAEDVAHEPVVGFVMGVYDGDLAAVTSEYITLDGAGSQPGPNRDIEGVRVYLASAVLKRGGFERDLGGGFAYRLQDVRKGNMVRIRHSRIDAVDFCTHLSIYRRPGGRVPPSPSEDSSRTVPYDVLRNAYQVLAARGYPPPSFWEPFPVCVPTAPAPRELRPKP